MSRVKKTEQEWKDEASYIEKVYEDKDFRNFNHDGMTFLKYCEMQCKFAYLDNAKDAYKRIGNVIRVSQWGQRIDLTLKPKP